jgi:hypothetical protein
LAELARARKDYAAARRLLEDASGPVQKALDAKPDHPFFRAVYCDNRPLLAMTLLDLGDHTAAATAAGDLARVACDPAGDPYKAATFFARCMPLAEADTKLPEAQRKEVARSYGDRAVQALRQAVAKGYKDGNQVKKDKDLDPLRQRDDFKTVVAELAPKGS